MIQDMRITREAGKLYTLYINGQTYTELILDEVYEIIEALDKDESELSERLDVE